MRKLLVAALVTAAGMSAASAQPIPTRPVTAIVPASAGGPTDTIGRIVMARAQQLLGQTIIIENVGGASGTIGTGRLVRADPDGYTIGIGGVNHYVVNASVYPLTYDTLKDFEPISLLATGPMLIMSRNSLPAKNLKEFIAWLKANPDNVTFGTGGLASPPHISGLSLQTVTGNKFQFVPFRGSAPALQQVLGSQLDMIIDQASAALSIAKGGGVRAYAVTSKQRLASAPDIPTVDEAGLPGLSRGDLAGRVGAEGHAEGRDRQAQRRDRGRACRPRRTEAPRRGRTGNADRGTDDAGRLRRVPQGRDGKVDADHQGGEHQA